MYNPFRPGWREGGPNTASGERYDPSGWAAAIKTSLRQKFGGVQYGAKPKYALVEAVGKKVIVKINDVGPLTPGRIIDLNERTMRHFDPSLQLGVINDVTVRPLSGDDWTSGPVRDGLLAAEFLKRLHLWRQDAGGRNLHAGDRTCLCCPAARRQQSRRRPQRS